MQQVQRIRYVFAALFVTGALVGTAAAQEPQGQEPSKQQPSERPEGKQEQTKKEAGAPTEVMAERMSATATVDKVDLKKREVMLKDDQGKEMKVNVPKNVKNLNAIKKGDTVTIDYYSSVALALHKGEKGKAPGAEETTMVERKAGKLPGGIVARRIDATVEVVDVDKSANTVTIKGPAGEMDTIKVKDPEMQSDLDKLSAGDKIHAKYTEAVAISVTPQAKSKG
jgi:hypothetical protein